MKHNLSPHSTLYILHSWGIIVNPSHTMKKKKVGLANKFFIRNRSVSWHPTFITYCITQTHARQRNIKETTLQITVKNAKCTYPAPWGTARCSRPEWGPSWRIRSRNGVGLLEQINAPWYVTSITYNRCSQNVYKQCRVPSTRGLTVGRPVLWQPRSPFCKNAYRSYRKNCRRSAEGRKL
jgi:hypothetical protein